MPAHGVLGITFACVRVLQAVCTVPIIGIVANFIGQAISSNEPAPQVLVGILCVSCIALLYTTLSFILYLDSMLPFLITAAVDFLVLIAVIVVAVVIGQPLTYLNCWAIGDPSADQNMYEFDSALGNGAVQAFSTPFNLATWVGASQQTCFQMKGVWGLDISLCILFAFSITCMLSLWRKKPAAKSVSKGEMV